MVEAPAPAVGRQFARQVLVEFCSVGDTSTGVLLKLERKRGIEYLLLSLQGGSREQRRRYGNVVCKIPFAHRGQQCIGMIAFKVAGAAMGVFHEVTSNLVVPVADTVCLDIGGTE